MWVQLSLSIVHSSISDTIITIMTLQLNHSICHLHTIAAESILSKVEATVARAGEGAVGVGADVLAGMGEFITLVDLCMSQPQDNV